MSEPSTTSPPAGNGRKAEAMLGWDREDGSYTVTVVFPWDAWTEAQQLFHAISHGGTDVPVRPTAVVSCGQTLTPFVSCTKNTGHEGRHASSPALQWDNQMCWMLSPDTASICIKDVGHSGRHGWER